MEDAWDANRRDFEERLRGLLNLDAHHNTLGSQHCQDPEIHSPLPNLPNGPDLRQESSMLEPDSQQMCLEAAEEDLDASARAKVDKTEGQEAQAELPRRDTSAS